MQFSPTIPKSAQKILLALISGMAMGLATPPFSLWPLAWIALAPLWLLICDRTPSTLLKKSGLGLIWGCGYYGLALFWITGIHPMTWLGVPWLASLAIAMFCWVFITLWGAVLVALWSGGFYLLAGKLHKTHRIPLLVQRIIVGIALWCGLETLWSLGPLYWNPLSFTQSPHNLAILQLNQLSGPQTVVAAIVAVNGLIAEAIIRIEKISDRHRAVLIALPIIVVLSLHGIGWQLYNRPLETPSAAALKIGIIQGNIPNTIKLYETGIRRALANYTNGYETLVKQEVDAVLTPEGALPIFESDLWQTSLITAIETHKIPAWVGAFGERSPGYTNSLLTITGAGNYVSRYDKVNLVPLGEYIPLQQWLGGLISRLSPLEAQQLAGSPTQQFQTPDGLAIAGICYDSAFPEHFRRQTAQGGEFILTASNNAHYSPAMPAQHHALDVMRAIESDRWAVRATNTGYSGIVDPRGQTRWLSSLNTYEVHASTIYRRQTQTLYVQWGDWLTVFWLVFAIASWLLQ